jgi:hypothetical protein
MDWRQKAAFALFALALAAPSCHIPGGCNCPSDGPATTTVLIEAAESSPIVAVAAEPPCSARASGANTASDPKDFVTVSSSSAGTCRVLARLANGGTYAIDVEFVSADLGCCGNGVEVSNYPVAVPTDAGIDARG